MVGTYSAGDFHNGHWEGDFIICKRIRPVLVLRERKSRVTLAVRLAGKTAAETISVMLAVFARIEPALRKSITFDNDTAFAQHALLRTMRAMTTWFCDAYASWQKGGVENANGRLRRRGQRLEFVELSLHKPLPPECLWREYNAFR